MSATNRCVVLCKRPAPGPVAESAWAVEKRPVEAPGDGEVLVEVAYIDVQPAMRSWLNENPPYTRRIEEGEVMRAQGVGKIVASRHPEYAVGEHVHGTLGVQAFCVIRPGPEPGRQLTRLNLALAPLHQHLSALGSSGMTAYFGLLDVGLLKRSDTVVISSAAGAVGSVAGQIAKLHGCRVVGIAGGPDKCRYLVEELGFDAAVDYKVENPFEGLAAHCPEGIDLYFDNVGGELLDLALLLLRKRARVVISGMLSQYIATTPATGPKFYGMLLLRHARMEGFLAADYSERYPEARERIADWMRDGSIRSREHIVEGIEAFPQTFPMLFDGRSFGKLLIRV